MKKLILSLAVVSVFNLTAVTSQAAPKKEAPAPAATENVTAADRAGRFVSDGFHLIGAALKWTGKTVGSVASSAGNAAQNVASSAGGAVSGLVNRLSGEKKEATGPRR